MGKLLILNPKFEMATKCWFPWNLDLKDKMEEKKVDCIILNENDDVQAKVWSFLKSEDVRAIAGVGHGNASTFTGQGYNIIFTTCNYPRELIKGRCFAPVSCLVGQQLLPDMEQKGLGFGLGMLKEYVFFVANTQDPLRDSILANFTLSERKFWFCLVNGYNAKQSWDAAKHEYLRRANKIKCPHVAKALEQDALQRSTFGDGNWRFSQGPGPQPPTPPAPPEEKWQEYWVEIPQPFIIRVKPKKG